MSTIIAIETSTELASAALLHNGQVLAHEASGAQTHSQTILPMVQSLLAAAGIPLSRCDAVAFGAGPGSFTGVRTACGIAQGLAFGLDLPVVPVVTLLAMAQACREQAQARNVLAVLDARMGEVYWAQYAFDDRRGAWETLAEPALALPADVKPAGATLACGNGMTAYMAAFADRPFAAGALGEILPHAAQVARLAAASLANGGGVAAREAQPIYLRNKVALTTNERMLAKAEAAGAGAGA
ncbi:MAG TPA: tRNA (adenosine(37)-N6)-threonylcarbamoyltransferase complex dimerization subunit type 1 TsaB [Paucimonas sp.]|nr:tRNA (adenosine(37)-N6)-threonylcarbamoyltransferase complex dimerization subunit type 1 TsaB [Paucimonas sp.]